MSVSFDRAAEYYDSTRALPEEDMRRIVAALAERMRPAGRALEIGVGTGRRHAGRDGDVPRRRGDAGYGNVIGR